MHTITDGGTSVGDKAASLNAPPRSGAWFDAVLTRIGLRTPLARDSALAVVVALINLALTWTLIAMLDTTGAVIFSGGVLMAVLAVTALQSLLLCLRRVSPILCLALIAAAQVALVALLPPGIGLRGLAPIIAAYTVGTLLRLRPALITIAVVGLLEVAASTAVNLLISAPLHSVEPSMLDALLGRDAVSAGPAQYVADAGSTLLTYLTAVLVGLAIATRRRYVDLVRLRAAEAIRDEQNRADAAIAAERSRMARELHDIAAHHLSGMVVQSAAVQRLIDTDPQAAKEATAWIRGQGKETLTNLRMVVGVLREPQGLSPAADGDASDDAHAPVPGIDAADDLIHTARDLGTPVDLVREGAPYPLAPVADVTVYRVLQEALSNARQHAPGVPVTATLRYRRDAIILTVDNAAPSHAPPHTDRQGHGLIGMRERAQLIRASFDAAPTPDGGWSVTLTVPAEASSLASQPAESNNTDVNNTGQTGAPA